jgi:hypothetical protein
LNDDATDQPTVLRLYGAGMGIREIAPARTLLAASMTNRWDVGATGVVAPGDSGSPVISDDGRAVGIQYLVGVVWGGLPGTPEFTPGNVAIYRLRPQVSAAERIIDLRLELMTARRAGS